MIESAPGYFVVLMFYCYSHYEDLELNLSFRPCFLRSAGFSHPIYCVECEGTKRIRLISNSNLLSGLLLEWKDALIVDKPLPGTKVAAKNPLISAGPGIIRSISLWGLVKLLRESDYGLKIFLAGRDGQTRLPESAGPSSTISLTFVLNLWVTYWDIVIYLGLCIEANQQPSLYLGIESPHWT
jgi:hypothetical protein